MKRAIACLAIIAVLAGLLYGSWTAYGAVRAYFWTGNAYAYTVAQLQARISADPRAWIGRTVQVHATAYSLLSMNFWDDLFGQGQQSSIGHGATAQAVARAIHCAGNTTWCIPYGLVDDIRQRGAVPYLRVVPQSDPFRSMLRQTPILSAFAPRAQSVSEAVPRVYRVRILSAPPCNATPCAIATVQLLDTAR